MDHLGALGPDRVAYLADRGIDAMVAGRAGVADEVMWELLSEGDRLDSLAFVIACLYTMRSCLPPGTTARLAVGRFRPNGEVTLVDRPVEEVAHEGQVLFARLLELYLGGRKDELVEAWLGAEQLTQAGAIGSALRAASDLSRSQRAALQ